MTFGNLTMLQYFKTIGLALLLSVGFGGVANSDGKLCRYSLSNLRENHCADNSIKSYQNDYLGEIISQGNGVSVSARWEWCVSNNLLSVVECSFMIRPDLDFIKSQINTELVRIMNVVNLSESEKEQLLESQRVFQKRVNDNCLVPNRGNAHSEWDERVVYGDEVCRLSHYAERLMLLSNKFENP
jgi:hypothetical protein